MYEGALEGMSNFEPGPKVYDSGRYEAIPSSLPTIYGPDPHPTITDISVRIPSQPKPNPNIGNILKKIESDSRSCLHTGRWTSCLLPNPAESDAAWEAYKSCINSKISKLKNFGYKVSERNLCYGFVTLMELWKLRHNPLCLLAPEVKEVD